MRALHIFLAIAILGFTLQSQESNTTFTFTAIDSIVHTQMDRIEVVNRTQNCDTILFWPDTVLELNESAGIDNLNSNTKRYKVYQNYPNPVITNTSIQIYVPDHGDVSIIISDVPGRTLYTTSLALDAGLNELQFTPGEEKVYFFTAFFQSRKSSIRIINGGSGKNELEVSYKGSINSIARSQDQKDTQYFIYEPGDEMLFIAHRNELQSGITDAPDTSMLYTFQFASGFPCPGIPTVTYEDQVYNTVQIFSQCWLKENLNVGVHVGSQHWQWNDSIVEKYCYWDCPDSCDKYGGLYTWREMIMGGGEGAQGICPDGWHIPTDEEWKTLEGSVDSLYGIGDPEWDIGNASRGYDVGKNLKTTTGWSGPRNGTDKFGFSALPGGFSGVDEAHNVYFYGVGMEAEWWSSTNYNIRRMYEFWPDQTMRQSIHYLCGSSVRCIKD